MSGRRLRIIGGALSSALLFAGAGPAASADDETIAEARELAQTFQMTLKQALVEAMSDGGPANAIGVCSERAPQIAAGLSDRTGWKVGRTALRVRNADNAPSPGEAEILREFQEALAEGANPKTLEHTSVVDTDEGRMLHYMKAIPTAEVCTICHGETVDPKLLKTIRKTYPQDAAVGFKPGDLRGAFTFYKPLEDG